MLGCILKSEYFRKNCKVTYWGLKERRHLAVRSGQTLNVKHCVTSSLSRVTCCICGSSVTVLVFCTLALSTGKEDVATPSLPVYIEDGEHHVW
jgi:hypothetical protein